MLPFHQFLPDALKRRGFSLRSASLKIGRSAPYLATLCREKNEPTLGALLELSKLLNLSVDDIANGRDIHQPLALDAFTMMKSNAETFAAYAAKHARDAIDFRSDEPNLEIFISWYMSTDGDISKLGDLRPYVDIYNVPKSDAVRPLLKDLGAKSLAARTISSPSTKRLEALLFLAPAAISRLVVLGHLQCSQRGLHCSVEKIDFPIDNGDRISLRYLRSLFLGRQNKKPYIVNYSKVIV